MEANECREDRFDASGDFRCLDLCLRLDLALASSGLDSSFGGGLVLGT
jgi:hypothetical protein